MTGLCPSTTAEACGSLRGSEPPIERSWQPEWGGQAVNGTDHENKERNREIAQNESTRQTVGDIRVSAWAVAAAVVIGLAAVGWVLLHNN